MLDVAERESASRLQGVARLAAERFLPRPLDERHRDAAAARGVHVFDLPDGMADLVARMPAVLAHGMHDRLSAQARALSREDTDEQRTVDQLRADLLADLVLTGAPSAHEPVQLLGAVSAEVHVTVPVLTLAGDAAEPAMLDGVHPVDTATALQLVGAAAGWDRVLTHPVTGAVLAVDRYRPTAELRRFLRAVDQRCRFPGCGMPARRCDLDHVQDAALGGGTEAGNLTDVCRRHHVMKHHTAWRSRKDSDGTLHWVSPTGREYPDRLPPRVAFAPAGHPPDPPPPPF